MKFAIITHAEHKVKNKHVFAYEPYVREMNLWLKYVDEVCIVAPELHSEISKIESEYKHGNIVLNKVSSFNLLSFTGAFKTLFLIPKICFDIFRAMKWADHIHLRCPGNIGFLGCFVQVLFPNKPKTIKYAGNWDPKSKQPWSYRLQKWILSNTFLTRNAKVLVYGEWPNQTKNITPFFTASYSEEEFNSDKILRHSSPNDESHVLKRSDEMLKQVQHDEHSVISYTKNRHPELDSGSHSIDHNELVAMSHTPCLPNRQARNDMSLINILFVGALTKGKQPLLSVKVVHSLLDKGFSIKLYMYGEGVERPTIETYIEENKLQESVILAGNVSQKVLKEAYRNSHFLVFISKSEGWPKVVTEAMFWGCLPISSHVSCIPYMLDDGNRGALVSADASKIVSAVEDYIQDKEKYHIHVENAVRWSRKYTLEKFDEEIEKILTSFSA